MIPILSRIERRLDRFIVLHGLTPNRLYIGGHYKKALEKELITQGLSCPKGGVCFSVCREWFYCTSREGFA